MLFVTVPSDSVQFVRPLEVRPSGNPPCPTCRGLKYSRMLIEDATVLVAEVCPTCEGEGSEA